MVRKDFYPTKKDFDDLQDFFRPFNAHLYRLIGRDLEWEKTTFSQLH